MTERLIHDTVTFAHSFSIAGVEGTFQPGTYAVEVTEQQLAGLSFVAHRRVSTTIRLPATWAASTSWQIVEIAPADLAASLARDASRVASDSDLVRTDRARN